jgi:hypothetical protein
MGSFIHLTLLCVLICDAGVAKNFSKEGSEPLYLSVRLFNYAPRCSQESRHDAQEIASRIFQRAGIELRWTDCTLLADGTTASPACLAPFEPSAVILRLVPVSPATMAHFGRDTLGIAAQPEEGTHASASVFYDRVEQLAHSWLVSLPVVMGHAMAHEIGHLILSVESHSASGLMRFHWSKKDLSHAAEGNLLFTPEQAETIKAEVLRRQVAGLIRQPERRHQVTQGGR